MDDHMAATAMEILARSEDNAFLRPDEITSLLTIEDIALRDDDNRIRIRSWAITLRWQWCRR